MSLPCIGMESLNGVGNPYTNLNNDDIAEPGRKKKFTKSALKIVKKALTAIEEIPVDNNQIAYLGEVHKTMPTDPSSALLFTCTALGALGCITLQQQLNPNRTDRNTDIPQESKIT